MPRYDYACTSCGRTIEVLHGINATGPTTCEVCGGPMRKQMSAPAIHFKGSGWAKKDARSTARAAVGATAGNGESAANASSEPAAASSSGDAAKEGGATTAEPAGPSASPAASDAKPASSASGSTKASSRKSSPRKNAPASTGDG